MKRLVSLLFLLPLLSACKNDDPVPHRISETALKDYLVISIAFDAAGTAWLGTLGQGLVRYGALGIEVFDSTNSILSTAAIWDIEVDKKGNVWLGTDDLIKYDGLRFTRFDASEYGLPRNAVRAIGIDGLDNVWFSAGAFRVGGLVKYDGKHFTAFTPENSKLPGNLISGIAIDKQNTVWVALNDVVDATSIVRISNGQWDIFGAKELGFSPYYYGNIMVNQDDELLASINYGLSSTIVPGRPQIFKFDGKSTQVINLPHENEVVYMTQTVFTDRQNRIWAAFRSDKEYGVFSNGHWELKDLDGSGGIFAFGQSPSGAIWIGTGQGVYILE